MPQLATRPWTTACVALAGAGVVAVTPVTVPLPGLADAAVAAVQLLAGGEAITLDLVRHGESVDNAEGILGTLPPGAALTPAGELQAAAVAPLIADSYPDGIAGIYSSTLLRAQETAAPLAELLGLPVTNLAGLNEVNAGFLEGADLTTFTEIGYVLPQLMWILGLYWVPMLGSDIDPNGMAFQDRFGDAVQTIYDDTLTDGDGKLTSVAYAHAGAIAAWALMNVKNPDFGLVVNQLIDTHNPLSNTGQVVLAGNPDDGWTLVSWDGTDIAAQPDLLTALFVSWRDLMVAPQMASWHIWEAVIGGQSGTILPAIQAGFEQVATALVQFPHAVIDDFVNAFSPTDLPGGAAGDLPGELAAAALSVF